MSTSLDALLEKFGGKLAGDISTVHTITGISLDSKAVKSGELFAALPGNRVHGAEFAEGTAAAAILTDAAGAGILENRHEDRPVWVVDDLRGVLGYIAAEIYGQPSQKMQVIGITGTSGKTTTSYILESALPVRRSASSARRVRVSMALRFLPA